MRHYLFLAILLVLVACDSPQNPEFQKLENVRFKTAKIGGNWDITLSGDALFHNPNTLAATLSGLDLEVFVDGKKVSDLKQDVRVEVPAKADFQLPIQTQIPIKEVFRDIKGTLGSLLQKKVVEYQLKGKATFDVGGLHIPVPVDYQDEQEIKLSADLPLIFN